MYQNMFAINRESSESLQKQIRRQIAIAIVNRQLPLHQPLPSIRKLATQLNVSVNTMALAYEALKQDGFIDSRDRSGFYVNVDIYQEGQLDKWAHQLTPQEPEQQFDFSAFFERRSYNLPRVSKPSDCLVRYNYPFICGLVDPSLFPIASWRECIRDSVNVVELKNWAADFSRIDDPLLIEQLIQRVLSRRGLIAHPDEVLITVGGQQALYIAIKTLLGSGAKIGIEDPGYADAVNIAQMESLHIERLPVDSQGL
ncbi:MAG: GntR family transcriptional regulator, partial [Pseudomonadales bacterium]